MQLQDYFTEQLIELEDGIYRTKESRELKGYDSISKFYDIVVGSRLYNRLLWGNSVDDYKKFAGEAVQSAGSVIVDAGCGSLNFTLEAYLKSNCGIILIDSSIEMLHICKKKLKPSGKFGKSIFCVQSDILKLSLKPGRVDAIISMGMMHLFDNADVCRLIKQFGAVLKENGAIYLSSLCPVNSFSKRYINLLYSKGEVAAPRNPEELTKLMQSCTSSVINNTYKGSMLYQTLTRK